MSENKNLVVKMTINSTEFDNSLKNAKLSMKKLESSTSVAGKSIKNFISGAVKGFGALGLAVTGTEMFKSFINSTQTMGDAWNNAMVTAKTSFQVLETAVATGSSTILENFGQSIRAAHDFAQAMDALGSAKISNQYARMEYVTPFNEEMTKYRDAKSKGNETGMAFAAANMERYLSDYKTNAQNIMMASRKAVASKLSAYTGGFVNEDNLNKYLDQLYLEIINGVFPPILKDFRNLDVELKKGDYFYNKAKDEMEKNYGPGWRREAEAMNALAEINDSTLNEMLDVIKTYDSVRNEINGMRRQMVRVMGSEKTEKTVTGASKPGGLTWEQEQEYYRRIMQRVPIEKEYTPYEPMIEEENIIEEETDAIVASFWERQKAMEAMEITATDTINTLNALSSALTAIGKISDGETFGNLVGGLASVASQAASTIASMMALAKAETIEGLAENFANAAFGTKLAVTATALAGILGMIASVKQAFAGSYASGGVVPGTSYTGDKLIARVNSGEMILNRDQQNNLSNVFASIEAAKQAFAGSYASGGVVPGTSYTGDKLIARVNSGEMILNRNQQAALAGGGEVKFVIEGSQLKGVLDNYESINNM